MTTSRTHTLQVQGAGSSIQLAELRWLVEQLKSAKDDLKVNVTKYEGDQRDPGYVTLRVDVPDTPAKPQVLHR